MKMSKMSKLGRPCNKLHAVSFVAAHSTRDAKQNVQDLPSLTHFYGKNRSFQNLRNLQTKVPFLNVVCKRARYILVVVYSVHYFRYLGRVGVVDNFGLDMRYFVELGACPNPGSQ